MNGFNALVLAGRRDSENPFAEVQAETHRALLDVVGAHATAEELLAWLPEDAVLVTAHRKTPPRAPLLGRGDLEDLHRTLVAVRNGTAESSLLFPRVYRVNEEVELYTDFPWAEDW